MTMVVDFADGFSSSTAPVLEGLGNETFLIDNNKSTFTNFTGLEFGANSSVFASFEVERKTDSVTYRQTGSVIFRKNTSAGTWDMEFGGFVGDDLVQTSISLAQHIILQITNAGQVQYKSGNMSGTGYSGKFKLNLSRINS